MLKQTTGPEDGPGVLAPGVRKAGADFTVAGPDTRTHVVRFTEDLGLPRDQAFQVRRPEFDQLLFEHARDGVRVKAIAFGRNGRPEQLEATAADGAKFSVRPRYVVDGAARDPSREAARFSGDTLQEGNP